MGELGFRKFKYLIMSYKELTTNRLLDLFSSIILNHIKMFQVAVRSDPRKKHLLRVMKMLITR